LKRIRALRERARPARRQRAVGASIQTTNNAHPRRSTVENDRTNNKKSQPVNPAPQTGAGPRDRFPSTSEGGIASLSGETTFRFAPPALGRRITGVRRTQWLDQQEVRLLALAGIGADRQEAEDEELTAQLARIPDVTEALREATPAIKREVYAAFDLQIAHDKVNRRVELLATVSEAIADAFEDAKALQTEGSSVVARDIAGARFVSRYDARIVERVRLRA
jgi:hypothetical protein